jgi:hypothetical protein
MLLCNVCLRLLNHYSGCFFQEEYTLKKSWDGENKNCETSKQRPPQPPLLNLGSHSQTPTGSEHLCMRVLYSHANRRGKSVLQEIWPRTVLTGEGHFRPHGSCVFDRPSKFIRTGRGVLETFFRTSKIKWWRQPTQSEPGGQMTNE